MIYAPAEAGRNISVAMVRKRQCVVEERWRRNTERSSANVSCHGA